VRYIALKNEGQGIQHRHVPEHMCARKQACSRVETERSEVLSAEKRGSANTVLACPENMCTRRQACSTVETRRSEVLSTEKRRSEVLGIGKLKNEGQGTQHWHVPEHLCTRSQACSRVETERSEVLST